MVTKYSTVQYKYSTVNFKPSDVVDVFVWRVWGAGCGGGGEGECFLNF